MVGLVLEGGGAKGAFHVGAVKAMKELGITYDTVVGTSIGSINGAIIAMQELEFLEEFWLNVSINDVINGDEKLLSKLSTFDFKDEFSEIRKFFMETLKNGGLDVTPFREALRKYVDEDALRASKIDYGLVTLSLTDLKPIEIFIKDIPPGKLHDYMMASANFPAFKLEKMDNKLFVDGGLFDNLPINMLVEKGYDEIIAIRVMGMGRLRKIRNEKKLKITMIKPSEDLGKTLEINAEKAAYNIKMGYYDTYRVFQKLKGKWYYIKGELDEALIFNELISLSDRTVDVIGRLLNIDKPPKRLLFEDVIPLMRELLEADPKATYGEIALSLYEFLAKELKIDRFSILTFRQLVGLVHRKLRETKLEMLSDRNEMTQKLVGILSTKTNALFTQKLKKETILHLFYILYEHGFLESGEGGTELPS